MLPCEPNQNGRQATIEFPSDAQRAINTVYYTGHSIPYRVRFAKQCMKELKMKRREFLGAAASAFATGAWRRVLPYLELSIAADAVYDMGKRLELFVDEYLVDTLEGDLSYRLHASSSGTSNPPDKPWEGNASSYQYI